MHPIMKNYRDSIESYCMVNGLSVPRVFASAQSGHPDAVTLYRRPVFSNAEEIVVDNTPMPIVLKIFLENGKLRFEQTDLTRKYLGAEKESAAPRPVTSPLRPSIPRRRRDFAYA